MEPRARRDESFPKRVRIRRRVDFLRTQRRGQKFHTERFLVFVSKTGAAHARLGITVSKKVGSAVERNLIKRRLREVYRRHKDLFPAGLDVVFVAKKEALGAKIEAILEEVRVFARWAGGLRSPSGRPLPRPSPSPRK